MQSKPLHLPGLNGLRAIAALAVVISHITQGLNEFGLNPFIFGRTPEGTPKGLDMAGFGVSIFFSLSGFLITYLLLLEKEQKEINIKHFYLRRILRIWPLYYMYFAICLLVAYYIGSEFKISSLLLYTFYAANVPFILGTMLPFLGHYWSLGVEEQFYLFWPWLVKSSTKKLLFFIASLTIGLLTLKLLFRFIIPNGDQSLIYSLIHVTRFHCMLIGAWGALLYYKGHAVFIKVSTNKLTQLLAWAAMCLIAANRFHLASVLDNELVSVVALVLIMGQITKKNRVINLEGNWFDFLGKISYGMYVIHPLIIFGLSKIYGHLALNETLKYVIVYISIVGTTILLAYLSYEYFEKWFLLLKHKYAVIKTSATKSYTDTADDEAKSIYMEEKARPA